ncbi:MAG: sensor domain-containing diguanylate cyclase [Eubacteriales bacterium]|nr:sensor domain-containing diguanylate cyclase [Eubacteriales bacterium]
MQGTFTGSSYEAEYNHIKERLHVTLKIAHLNGWEWDLKSKVLSLINTSEAECMARISPLMAAETSVIPHYPEILIQKGIISDSGIDMVRNYTHMIYTAGIGEQYSFRLPFRTMDGEVIWLQFNGVTFRDENGEPDIAIGTYINVTSLYENAERGYSMEDMLSSEVEKQKYIMMINGLTIDYSTVFFYDLNNDTYTPFRSDEVISKLLQERISRALHFTDVLSYYIENFVYEEDRDMMRLLIDPENIRQYLKDTNYFNLNYRSERLGELVYCQLKIACGNSSSIDSVVLGIRNIDAEYRSHQTLVLESRTDALTGILNKKAMLADIHQALYNNTGREVVFLFLDLDNFKQVNDKLGHAVGDQAIKDAANVISGIFRHSDIVGRFGGDEFCVFLPDIPEGVALKRIRQCLEGLRHEYTDGTNTVRVTSSIGAVYAMNDGTLHTEDLMKTADKALYQAKESGKNQYKIIYR